MARGLERAEERGTGRLQRWVVGQPREEVPSAALRLLVASESCLTAGAGPSQTKRVKGPGRRLKLRKAVSASLSAQWKAGSRAEGEDVKDQPAGGSGRPWENPSLSFSPLIPPCKQLFLFIRSWWN